MAWDLVVFQILAKALRNENLAFKAEETEKYTQYHKDGSIWAKGQTLDG